MSHGSSEIQHARMRRLTRAEYHRLGELGFFRGDERVELIHGILLEMAPIGPPHSNVVDHLMKIFVRRLPDDVTVRIQQPFVAWDESEPEPDVAVVPSRSYAKEHPDAAVLVVEVAESSLAYDRDTKAPLYARSGVPEYWIVDVAARAVIVHTDAAGDHYANVTRVSGALSPRAFPDVVVTVGELFA